MPKFPPRLHVLLARDTETGLVIRRGPSQSVCTLSWDRRRDTFQLGQWMRGRIYERRCDLSPDGKHFLYFAMNGRWSSQAKGAWTAISRVPYLKAVSLFAKGDGWHGGGLFLSHRKFWLNDGHGHQELFHDRILQRDLDYKPAGYYGGECLTVYFNRLQRDGWTRCAGDESEAVLWEKPLPQGWVLRKHAFAEIGAPPGRGCYWDAHELRHQPSGNTLPFPEWEWADWDGRRLVWATQGRLGTSRLGHGKLLAERILHDFSDMQFAAHVAPY